MAGDLAADPDGEGFYLLLSYTDVLVCSNFVSSEEVGVYFAVVKTLALVSFIHYAMSATTAHRLPNITLAATERGCLPMSRMRSNDVLPSLAATILLLAMGKRCCGCSDRNSSSLHIMFVAAHGLVYAPRSARSSGAHMLGISTLPLAYALAFAMNCAVRAWCPLRRPRRRRGDLDLACVRDRAAILDRADAARPSVWRSGRPPRPLVLRSGHLAASRRMRFHTGSWSETAQVRLLTRELIPIRVQPPSARDWRR